MPESEIAQPEKSNKKVRITLLFLMGIYKKRCERQTQTRYKKIIEK